MTIAIGLLSPLLAGIAVVVSLQAVHTSERALKIGARAYVAVIGGDLHFFNYGILRDKSGGYHCIVEMDLSATIQNAGNTPASASSFKPRYRVPEGWREAAWAKGSQQGSASIGTIGPKSTVNWSFTQLFELTPDTYNAFRNTSAESFIYMDAKVDFKDVFGENGIVTWCWVGVTNEKQTETTDCESALKPVLGIRPAPPRPLR